MTETDVGTGPPVNRRLEAELADRLAAAALRCEHGEVRDLDRSQVVRVASFDVQTASRCQAKAAMPPSEFEPTIFTTSRAVALRAVPWLRKSGSVVAAVSDTMRQIRRVDRRADADSAGPDLDWLAAYLTDESVAPLDVRVRIAARAVTWLTVTLDILETSASEVRRWRHDIRPRWRYPGRGLVLDGRVDLAVPVAGNFTPILVTNGNEAALDEAAFNVCLWTIGQRRPPDEVLVVDLAKASKQVLDPHTLFDRGIDAAGLAADAVTSRPEPGPALMRRPARFTCQNCEADCESRVRFLAQPVRKGGVQLTSAIAS